MVREEGRKLGVDAEMIKRPLNVGFSGGEKKRLETLQMSILKPTFAILDEADSGLDIDALKVVADGVNALRVNKISQESPNVMDLILGHKIDLVIDTPSQGVEHSKDGFLIRRNAIETGVNVLTAMDTARALVTSLENTDKNKLTLINIAEI